MRSMRFVALALFVASGAHAQGNPCVELPPPPPPGIPGDVPFGSVVLVSPPSFAVVPRNVEIQLGGSLSDLARGFFAVRLSVAGETLPSRVDSNGVVVVDGGLLPANVDVLLDIDITDTNPCPNCTAGPQQFTFTVSDLIDDEAPVIDDDAITLNAFVLPSLQEQQQCGFFNAETHAFEITIDDDSDANFSIGARSARDEPAILARSLAAGAPRTFTFSFGRESSFTLGEAIVFVITARDLAGNVSAPAVRRVRMRSFKDRGAPDLAPLSCELPIGPTVDVPSRVPRNPTLRVVFPFEEIPLALRPRSGGEDVSLVPVADVAEDARVGHLFQTARLVEAGDYDVVSLSCTRCLCQDCNVGPRQRITVVDVVDEAAAEASNVVAVFDDPAPALSEGACQPDDAATIVVLSPAGDDVSGAADLIYDAVVTTDGDLPRPAGNGLQALRRGDGNVVVRLPTGPLGRLAGSDFTLVLTARDVGGHVTRIVYDNVVVDEGGCNDAGGAGAGAVLLGLLGRRRRAGDLSH